MIHTLNLQLGGVTDSSENNAAAAAAAASVACHPNRHVCSFTEVLRLINAYFDAPHVECARQERREGVDLPGPDRSM